MILVPPNLNFGKLEVRTRVSDSSAPQLLDLSTLRAVEELHFLFRDRFYRDVPSAWVRTLVEEGERGTNTHVVVARAEAPRSAKTALIGPSGEVRTFQIPVNTGSRVRLVQMPWQEDHFPRPEHYLVFVGWDAETGLMVFDRKGERK